MQQCQASMRVNKERERHQPEQSTESEKYISSLLFHSGYVLNHKNHPQGKMLHCWILRELRQS